MTAEQEQQVIEISKCRTVRVGTGTESYMITRAYSEAGHR
jgi:hypothetical protein